MLARLQKDPETIRLRRGNSLSLTGGHPGSLLSQYWGPLHIVEACCN